MTDLYSILQVSRYASSEELKQAYRRLTKLYHPDLNPGNPMAEEKIKEINKAYDILSNPVKRENYDHLFRQFTAQPKTYHSTQQTYTPPYQAAPTGPPPNYSPFQYSPFEHPLERKIKRVLAVLMLIAIAITVFVLTTAEPEKNETAVAREVFDHINEKGDSVFNDEIITKNETTTIRQTRTGWPDVTTSLAKFQLEQWLKNRLTESTALYGYCNDDNCYTLENFRYTLYNDFLIIGSYVNGEYLQDAFLPLSTYEGLQTIDNNVYILSSQNNIKLETYVLHKQSTASKTPLGLKTDISNNLINLLDICLKKLADSSKNFRYPRYVKENLTQKELRLNEGFLASALENLKDSMHLINYKGNMYGLKAPSFEVQDNIITIRGKEREFIIPICHYSLNPYNPQDPSGYIEFLNAGTVEGIKIWLMPETGQETIRRVRKLFYACKLNCP